MRYIKLFEKYIAPFDASKKKAKKRMDTLGASEDFLDEAVGAMHEWFFGGFMGDGNNTKSKHAISLFKKIGEVYHTPMDGTMFRISHLHLHPGIEVKEIRNIKKANTGPKNLQSWSTTKTGAEWFFNHFVKEQNHHDSPKMDKSWVLVSTEANNLDQLLTFEECMQFCYDISSQYPAVEELADRLVSDEMLMLHELICKTPDEVPIEVENVLVPPGQDSKGRDEFMDFLRSMMDAKLKEMGEN